MVMAIYLLFEIMAIIVCLFLLCGEKIRVTYKMLCMIAVHIVLFTVCNYIGYSGLFSALIYLVITAYVIGEFRLPLHKALIRVAVMLLLCAGLQTIAAISVELLSQGKIETKYSNLCTNLLLFVVTYVLYRKVNMQEIIAYVKGGSKAATILLIGIFCIAVAYILYAKKSSTINGIDYLLFFTMAIIIIFLIGIWEKSRIQIKEKKIEIEVHEIYAESYKKLIDEIRTRQHEFDNHIQAIINQQFTCSTYEELVRVQSEYINAITFDNRYNKLLRQGNYVYIGFLYGKLVSIEEQGMDIAYKINIGQLRCDMPVYKLIEITNDLLSNACEALAFLTEFPRSIYLQIEETKDKILLEIRNIGEPLSPDFVRECFKKEYSKKGLGRGLGLYNVRNIAEQYGADIQFRNVLINHYNWVSFSVTIPKPIYVEDRL